MKRLPWIATLGAFLLVPFFAGGAREEARRAGIRSAAPWEGLEPGEAAVVTLSGGLRGLYLDYLWYRSQAILTQGRERLYELPLYYRPMAALQPQFVEMWTGTGWEMTFNASAQFSKPEEQWPWIRRGLDWMEEGIRRVGDHPKAHKLHEWLGFAYLYKCTPEQNPLGAYWRQKGIEAWGEDPYQRAVRHYLAMAESPGALSGRKHMVCHVYESWARFTDEPVPERERLLKAVEYWDRFVGPYDPASGLPDHKSRWIALADAAGERARMEEALRRGDPEEARAHWQNAIVLYARNYVECFDLMGRRGGFPEALPDGVQWSYSLRRLGRLLPPPGIWPRLDEELRTRYGKLPLNRDDRGWLELEPQLLRRAAELTEEHRRALGDKAPPYAAWGLE